MSVELVEVLAAIEHERWTGGGDAVKSLLLGALGLSACAHQVCGRLDPAAIAAFHQSHYDSVTANVSSVEDLAAERWLVCVSGGVATIQNHRTPVEVELDR